MKQIVQDLRSGETLLIEAPMPSCRPGHLLVESQASLISAGTERMLVEFGKSGWIQKARSQPDKVLQVLEKIKTDGLLATYEAVAHKLSQLVPLGYCNVGTVIEVGIGVSGVNIGDRVVSNGPHAEVVCVPKHLCALVPSEVSNEQAAFTVLAAVALQAIRLVAPNLGESVVVTGMGLVGLVAVQLLRANGCRVMGLDFNAERLRLAAEFGAETFNLSGGADPIEKANQWTNGRGVDAVVVATATSDDGPVRQAAQMCRQRGRIVLVGVAGLNLRRDDFFEKEIQFQVSCSYGPGRYDPNYEESGNDYPYGFVRWTEQRNFQAVLQLLHECKLDMSSIVSHRFSLDECLRAYELLSSGESSMGILLEYDAREREVHPRTICIPESGSEISRAPTKAVVGVIGAGGYATKAILPELKNTDARLHTIVSQGGTSAAIAGKRFGFKQASSDIDAVLKSDEVTAIIIATRHDSHAPLAIQALENGKHVFLEKPAAIDRQQLAALDSAVLSKPELQLMVGFNRRFSRTAAVLQSALKDRLEPVNVVYTVNAGQLPEGRWETDPAIGGGRIVGEACHFVDMIRYFVGESICSSFGHTLGGDMDNMAIQLGFEDGSMGTVHYTTNGSKGFPKERIEVFSQGRIAVIDNFRRLRWFGWPGQEKVSHFSQDKGQKTQFSSWVRALSDGTSSPISWSEIKETTTATFDARDSVSD